MIQTPLSPRTHSASNYSLLLRELHTTCSATLKYRLHLFDLNYKQFGFLVGTCHPRRLEAGFFLELTLKEVSGFI